MFTILNYVNNCMSLWGYLRAKEALIELGMVSYPLKQGFQIVKSHSTSAECWVWLNADPEKKPSLPFAAEPFSSPR